MTDDPTADADTNAGRTDTDPTHSLSPRDPAALDVLSDQEWEHERELAQTVRALDRRRRLKTARATNSAADRERRSTARMARKTDSDRMWHAEALEARRRVSSPHARLAKLHRRAEWSSRALIAVVLIGMTWAALNVQHNLVPSNDIADPLFWMSFGIEAMISVPLVVIMLVSTTSAEWGHTPKRERILLFELGLLLTTVGLNTGPHLAAHHYVHAAEYAVAPMMVGVVIWVHAYVAGQYAYLIAHAELPTTDDDSDAPHTHAPTHTPERTNASTEAAARTHTSGTDAFQTPENARPQHNSDAFEAPHQRTPTTSARTRTPATTAGSTRTRRRTIDREKILRYAREHPDWSNKRIARECGYSPTTVDKTFQDIPRTTVLTPPTTESTVDAS